MRNIYLDQAPQSHAFCSAVYTPHGIRLMDSAFIKQIKSATSLDDCKRIAREIASNLHLHVEIKENLLLNLRTAREHLDAHGVNPFS